MRVILAVLTGMAADASVLDHAAAEANGQGHVEVCHAKRDPRESIPLIGEGLSPELVQRMLDESAHEVDRRTAAARQAFDAWMQRTGASHRDEPGPAEGITARWLERTGHAEDMASAGGRLADLVVMARPSTDSAEGQSIVEAALFGSGRPLLLVPADAPVSRGAVAIFWNGSAEASRAVAASLPALGTAASVHIFQLDENLPTGAVQSGLAGYLAWHGIAAEVTTLSPDYREPGAALLEEAANVGATLVVMGAYTHSRMRQMILGGVTSHVLTASPVPVLLAH